MDTPNNDTLKQEDYAKYAKFGLSFLTWETEKRKLWEQMNNNTQHLRNIDERHIQMQKWPCKPGCDSGNHQKIRIYNKNRYINPHFSEDNVKCYSCYPTWDEFINEHYKRTKNVPHNFFRVQMWNCKPKCDSGFYKGCRSICYVCMPENAMSK
jgi:hypothetical protein